MMPEKTAHTNGRKVDNEMTEKRSADPVSFGVGESDEELIETNIEKIIELKLVK